MIATACPPDTLAQCEEFLRAIFEPGDVIEFRCLKPPQKRWGRLADLGSIVRELERANASGSQVYFGANPRKASGGSEEKDVALARCHFADFDGGVTVDEARQRIERAGLPAPTVLLSSGGGVHAWWRLSEPATDMKAWRATQKTLASRLGSDKSINDPPRIMRLPGFTNHKYPEKPVATVVEVAPDRVCAVEALRAMTTKKMSKATRAFIDHGDIGSHGGRREAMFAAACDLRDHKWSPEEAEAEIMPRMKSFADIPADEVDDCPRQIRNAWSRPPRSGARSLATTATALPPRTGAADVRHPSTWNDVGLGKRLAREAAGEIRFCSDRGLWLSWDGKRWCDDPAAGGPSRHAKRIAQSLWDEMAILGPEVPKPLYAFARGASSRRAIDAAVALARSEPGIETTSAAFDGDPYLLTVDNGILDLRTMKLRPHDPKAMMTKSAPVAFDPAAECPTWDAFIDTVTCGDRALAGFLQRSFGLSLSGDVSEQRLWVHHGDGANGKSTAFTVLRQVMGDYCSPIPATCLTTMRNEMDRERSTARLIGRRLCYALECGEGERLSEASVKALTGGDFLTSRELYERAVEARPTWHVHLATNDKPQVKGTNHALWRRILLIPWRHVFEGEELRPRAVVESELLAEAPGILRWLCDGYAAWKRDGLTPPLAVLSETGDYRSENDSVARWLEDSTEDDPTAETPAADLFESYRAWCSRETVPAVSQTRFGMALDARGYRVHRPKGGPWRDKRVRGGLKLLPLSVLEPAGG